MWLDLKGAVVADTVYDSGVLTAKDTSFTLPAISQMTADLNAMGTMTVPIVGLLENMELSITKIGEDKGLGKMSKLDKHSFEFRWVQNVVKADGSTYRRAARLFVRTFPPTAIPGTVQKSDPLRKTSSPTPRTACRSLSEVMSTCSSTD